MRFLPLRPLARQLMRHPPDAGNHVLPLAKEIGGDLAAVIQGSDRAVCRVIIAPPSQQITESNRLFATKPVSSETSKAAHTEKLASEVDGAFPQDTLVQRSYLPTMVPASCRHGGLTSRASESS